MSTEAIETSIELLKDDLVEYILDENLDIVDEFEAERVADLVIDMGRRLAHRDFCAGHMKKGKIDYLYKVNNKHGGFVSVSDYYLGTGVSTTLYYPFYADEEDGYFAGLCSLASMLNEAWYHCKNG